MRRGREGEEGEGREEAKCVDLTSLRHSKSLSGSASTSPWFFNCGILVSFKEGG